MVPTWLASASRAPIFRAVALCGIVTLGTLALDGSATARASAAPPDLNAALHQDLLDFLSARGTPEHISTLSMTIGFRDDPHDINDAVGATQFGGSKPVTPSNVFQIGSNTKSYTAALILQLEETGKLSIDDTLGKWLPQYPAWKDVTIKRLLNMTSGIPTYDATPAWEKVTTETPLAKLSAAQLIGYVYPSIKDNKGAWEYSNTGYLLAQLIIDKAGPSHSYARELQALIDKVGLKNTFYQSDFYPSSVMDRLVSGYYVNNDEGLKKIYGQDTSRFGLGWAQAAGGIISTPQDLVSWVRTLFEGKVLEPKQLAELTSLVAIPSGKPIDSTSSAQKEGFALGVFQITTPALGTFWGYQGSTLGYRAAYSYLPKSGLIICIFTNSQTVSSVAQVNSVLFDNVYKTLKAAGKV